MKITLQPFGFILNNLTIIIKNNKLVIYLTDITLPT